LWDHGRGEGAYFQAWELDSVRLDVESEELRAKLEGAEWGGSRGNWATQDAIEDRGGALGGKDSPLPRFLTTKKERGRTKVPT